MNKARIRPILRIAEPCELKRLRSLSRSTIVRRAVPISITRFPFPSLSLLAEACQCFLVVLMQNMEYLRYHASISLLRKKAILSINDQTSIISTCGALMCFPKARNCPRISSLFTVVLGIIYECSQLYYILNDLVNTMPTLFTEYRDRNICPVTVWVSQMLFKLPRTEELPTFERHDPGVPGKSVDGFPIHALWAPIF